MRLSLKAGEHLRLAADSHGSFSVTIGRDWLHIVANEPGEPMQVIMASTESAKVTAGAEPAEERN